MVPADAHAEEHELRGGAAVVDGALTALSGLKKLDVRPGRSVLVYGASGSIGTAAVQLAKHFGAHVTAVCNTKNVELLRALGADQVIDYQREAFTTNGKTYDVVFDAVGKQSYWPARRSLKRGGIFIDTDPGFMWHLLFMALLTRWIGDKKVKMLIARFSKQDLLFLRDLIENGEYRAVIDRLYPLDDVVDASKYVETGEKTGNVVLTVSG